MALLLAKSEIKSDFNSNIRLRNSGCSQIEDDFVMVNIEISKYVSLISTQWAEAEL